MIRTSIVSAALCCTLTAPLLAHDGDLKLLHKQPAYQGQGYSNLMLQGTLGDQLGTTVQPQVMALGAGFQSQRVTLLSWLTLPDFGVPQGGNGNSLWGYTSPGGKRYALMGTSDGTAFVDITAPNSPNIVTQIAGPNSLWRDIRTYQDHAYAISEGGSGIQIFDMSGIDLGNVVNLGTVNGSGTAKTHTVFVNEDSGYLYRAGGDSNGLRIYDLANPDVPVFVSSWSDRYVHEVTVYSYTSGPFAGREIAFACGGFNGGFQNTGLIVLDVTNKANIITMDVNEYPSAQFCHQVWLSEDKQYAYINDEFWVGPQTTIVIDVSDLNNTSYVGTFSNGTGSAAHNEYVVGDHLYQANYKSGLHVWDLSVSPTNPTTYAFFDTAPEDDADTYNSLWNVYPFFGNNVVVGSDIEKGMFVWYVGDPQLTLTLANGEPALIDPGGESLPVQMTEQSAGDFQSGTAMLHYDDGSGYVSVPMPDLGGLNFNAAFPALACGSEVDFYLSGQSTDGIVWVEPSEAPISTFHATVAGGIATTVDEDFEVDLGWTQTVGGASSGQWERGVPVDDGGWAYDPASDSDASGQCWTTQNQLGNTDVDGGSVTLLSPTLDLSGGNITLRYDYYLFLTNADGSDALVVEIDENDGAGPWTEVARHDTDGGLSWRSHGITQGDLDSAGVTLGTTMRLRFTANDADTQSIVEAGLDAFRVAEGRRTRGAPRLHHGSAVLLRRGRRCARVVPVRGRHAGYGLRHPAGHRWRQARRHHPGDEPAEPRDVLRLGLPGRHHADGARDPLDDPGGVAGHLRRRPALRRGSGRAPRGDVRRQWHLDPHVRPRGRCGQR
jgi:choice-of-anchor B domain-containing protein